jgi:signal transduction histidine kinase
VREPDLHPVLGRRLGRRGLVALDAAGAAAYALLLVTIAIGRGGPAPGAGPPLWARCGLAAAIALPLAGRRLWPWTVFLLVLAASLLSVVLDVVRDSFVGAALALYVVALTRPRRPWEPTVAIAAVSIAVALAMAVAGGGGGRAWTAVPVGCVLLGGAWTAGRAVRERRAYAARAAAELAGRAVTEERLRIARELHDVVAHGVGLIAVEAGVAGHVFDERPEEARHALRVIETSSRRALAEMRHLLGVLRSDAEAGEPAAALEPAPGVGGLRGLADRAALGGVRVTMDLRGLDGVPDGVGLSAYRIVQEALTNVVKHAAPAACRVVVEADGRAVRIEVADDGPGRRVLPAARPGGHGLVGMRERVALYGGAFSAGPRPGGFAVSVSLPYAP